MFTQDSRTENFLNSMGVKYKYTNKLKFEDLAPLWDTNNLARKDAPINEKAVIQYAGQMEGGSSAPAPIVILTKAGYAILDGVQRISAAQLYGTTIWPAYVVECDAPNIILAIRVLANTMQGYAETAEWTCRNAVKILVIGQGMSVPEVSGMGGWKPADIDKLVDSMEQQALVYAIGGPELPDTILRAIGDHTIDVPPITKTPVPIAKFLFLLKQSKLSAADADYYLGEFFAPFTPISKAHKVYTERVLDFSSDEEIQRRIKGRKPQSMPAEIRIRKALKSAITAIGEVVDAGSVVPFVDEYFQMNEEIKDLLHRLSKKHPKAGTERVPADKWAVKA